MTKPSDKLLALIGLSEIFKENLGTCVMEIEKEMKSNNLYVHKQKQTINKLNKLLRNLSDELNVSVDECQESDFIDQCDFIMEVVQRCVGVSPDDRIFVTSTLKNYNK